MTRKKRLLEYENFGKSQTNRHQFFSKKASKPKNLSSIKAHSTAYDF